VHAFAEAGVVTVFQAHALDLSWLVKSGTVSGSLLTGMLGFQPVPTVAEVTVWLAFAVPMGLYVLWPSRPRRPQRATSTQVSAA
jgi:high-affinity iron transporter